LGGVIDLLLSLIKMILSAANSAPAQTSLPLRLYVSSGNLLLLQWYIFKAEQEIDQVQFLDQPRYKTVAFLFFLGLMTVNSVSQ
jgi:hypothetical protein